MNMASSLLYWHWFADTFYAYFTMGRLHRAAGKNNIIRIGNLSHFTQ